MKSTNSKKKLLALKKQAKNSRSKFTSLNHIQNSIQLLENSKTQSEPAGGQQINPMVTVATFDQHWVKHEDYVKVLVESESRRMVGQAMYDCIVSSELQYQSITLMAILKNWKKI